MVTGHGVNVLIVLIFAVAMQRLLELRRSRRHEAALRAAGAREHAEWQVPVMAALHTVWIAATLVESQWFAAPSRPLVTAAALGVFAVGQFLRLAAMHALGTRWTIRVMTLPGRPPVSGGIYRFVRHPNYLGVVLEIAALPVACGAYRTAVVISVLNLVLLLFRVRAEERALALDNHYFDYFGSRSAASRASRPDRR